MRKYTSAALTLAIAAACAVDGPTTPVASAPAATANRSHWNGNVDGNFPGWNRTPAAVAGTFVPLNCVPKELSEGSARIGPAGGILQIGNHRLIVPSGALTETVVISGTVPAGKPFEVDLQPHGLQFRKAAGLILDASSCTEVPTIVYIVDQFNLGPPIAAFYSNWWKAIACPIWHFSGYMIALGEGASSNEIGAQ
jgi:hypothetical protein